MHTARPVYGDKNNPVISWRFLPGYPGAARAHSSEEQNNQERVSHH
jgi:hypothetical protein